MAVARVSGPRTDRGLISAVVLTLNEELHLPACMDSLRWCSDVVVLDSFSTDATETIARQHGARFVQNRFEGFGLQRNWALDHVADLRPWVLFLDADERVPPELAGELMCLASTASPDVAAFRFRRRFHLWNRWLPRSSLYPTWVVRMVRRGRVRYVDRGHAETQVVDGLVGELVNDLVDENLRGLEAWFARQNRYSTREARHQEGEGARSDCVLELGGFFARDPLVRRETLKRIARRVPLRGPWYFLYSYILRGGCLEGRDGLYLCIMRAIYEQMVEVKCYDLRRRRGHGPE